MKSGNLNLLEPSGSLQAFTYYILPKSGNCNWKVGIENYFRPFKDDRHYVDFSSNQSIGKILKTSRGGGGETEKMAENFGNNIKKKTLLL